MRDISDLKVREMLRREFKKWTRVAGNNLHISRYSNLYFYISKLGIIHLSNYVMHLNYSTYSIPCDSCFVIILWSGKPNSTGSRLTISHVGMSSVGTSLEELLTQETSAVEELIRFQGKKYVISCFLHGMQFLFPSGYSW